MSRPTFAIVTPSYNTRAHVGAAITSVLEQDWPHVDYVVMDGGSTDNTVEVRSGHLEGSNVSAVEEMVATMSLNRTFEMQMKLFKAADEMTQAGNRLVGG